MDGSLVALKFSSVRLPDQTYVIVTGLNNVKEYNGKCGKIVGFDEVVEWYMVELGAGQNLKLKPENAMV